MNTRAQLRFWIIGIALAGILLYLLRGILLPFVAGMAVAFLFDPLADRFEKAGLSRVMATVVIRSSLPQTWIDTPSSANPPSRGRC